LSSAELAATGFEEIVTGLEKTIGQLAAGTAPLDELVAAHERAARLLAEAQQRLAELEDRAGKILKLLE
jgi:exodeoxyribonuclease VII small subunit